MADERNPFDPDPEGSALRLTLDSRSLSRLDGDAADEAEFLYSLCDSHELDGLTTWAMDGFASNVPAAVMRPGRGHEDSVAVSMFGEEHGYIGVIPLFGQWERLAGDLELSPDDHERLIETGPRLSFHRSSKRHLFVCGDPVLLAQRGKSPFTNLWKGIFSVRETLALVGAALRPYGKLYEEVEGGYSRAISNYTVRNELAVAGLPNRRRIFQWLREQDARDKRVQAMSGLEQALHLRATELLRARDAIEREEHRLSHNNATADEVLYHLRAAVAALAAASDTLASLAALALELPEEEVGDPLRVGFSQRHFRKVLRQQGDHATAEAASRAAPLLALIKAFRDPIIHQAGPSGATIHHVGASAFSESRISELSTEQVAAIRGLGGGTQEVARWGLRDEPPWSSVAPLAFVRNLALRGMRFLDDLLEGLATDLGLPPHSPCPIDSRRLNRMRLLCGFDPTGLA